MSAKAVFSFHLSPSDTGYTLQMDFPSLGTQKEIPFTVGESAEQGATFDLHSQNGKVGGRHSLSFFSSQDLREIKSAVKLPLPPCEGKTQSLFVLDLKDQNGRYEDLESIRQS